MAGMRFVIRLIVTALAIWAAVGLVQGITINSGVGGTALSDFLVLLFVALIFTLVNTIVKPFLNILSLPLRILTLGLFSLVINALMLWLTAWISSQFEYGITVSGFWSAFWGAIIIAIVNFLLSAFVPNKR
jgi:putative membrane protein